MGQRLFRLIELSKWDSVTNPSGSVVQRSWDIPVPALFYNASDFMSLLSFLGVKDSI